MDVAMDVIEEVKTANEDRGTIYENFEFVVIVCWCETSR